MPSPGEIVAAVVRFVGDQIAASSLRLGPVPTITAFAVVLVLLSLVARPSTRWTLRDLGRLAAVPRAMALAAEAGSVAVFSLGAAGVARNAAAADRIQTLAALPLLGHVARAAARSGVPLRVTANDPVAVHLAESTLAEAHRHTETEERGERSQAAYLGEGRPAAAAAALSASERPEASFVLGGLGEEALLMLSGKPGHADSTTYGTAAPSQASSVVLLGSGALIGPELFQAPADLGASVGARTGALAANRLLLGALGVLVLGSLAALASGVDLATVIAGR